MFCPVLPEEWFAFSHNPGSILTLKLIMVPGQGAPGEVGNVEEEEELPHEHPVGHGHGPRVCVQQGDRTAFPKELHSYTIY